MEEAVSMMETIQEASSKVSKIIQVIEDIAFQTNLLALNAAVEAARAGEHGKGFAVVAEEVRSLAGRTAEASKETAPLIEKSVNYAAGGKEAVDRAAKTLGKIAESAREVSSLVESIKGASGDQAAGVAQISQAMAGIGDVTQKNVEVSNQVGEIAEEVFKETEEIRSIIQDLEILVEGGKKA